MSEIYHIIPYPNKIKELPGFVKLTDDLVYQEEQTQELGEEGYTLSITENGVLAKGNKIGLYYAKVTWEQLQNQFKEQMPCLLIQDQPLFSYRGFMLDSVRHFIPKNDIKKLLDCAAMFKINRMHWHLTDDQGFRLEIKSFPLLTEIGALRGKVHYGDIEEPEMSHDYYSQEDVKEIVAYARERMIEIVPELEIPGHESALLTAYPEAFCTSIEGAFEAPVVQQRGGIFHYLLCAGKEKSFEMIAKILDEIMLLFPSEYIHLGGDEACKKLWRSCRDCQKKIKELGLSDENELQQWFTIRVANYLEDHGRRAIVWNDTLRGKKLSNHMMIQSWMGDQSLIKDFLSRGGQMIQSDNSVYYLDYPYYISDVEHILSFDPYPSYVSEEEKKGVTGLECPLWTERVPDLERITHLLFPRLSAMAERAWNSNETKNLQKSFFERFEPFVSELEKRGISCAPKAYWKIDNITAKLEKEIEDRLFNTPENLNAMKLDEEAVAEEERFYPPQDILRNGD